MAGDINSFVWGKLLPVLQVGFALLGSMRAPAAEPDPNAQAGSHAVLMVDLLGWLYKHGTGSGEHREPPALQRLGRAQLYALAFDKAFPLTRSEQSPEVQGLYHFEHRTIYLLDTLDLDGD